MALALQQYVPPSVPLPVPGRAPCHTSVQAVPSPPWGARASGCLLGCSAAPHVSHQPSSCRRCSPRLRRAPLAQGAAEPREEWDRGSFMSPARNLYGAAGSF